MSEKRITLLADNSAKPGLEAEHGLSVLIESNEDSVLFDAGQSDLWLRNLKRLGGDPSTIKAAAISHGHYDHTGGLNALVDVAPQAKLYAHPACFDPKYAKTDQSMRFIGMPPESARLQPEFNLSRTKIEILPGIILSGEISLHSATTISDNRFLTSVNGIKTDTFKDEQCLVVKNGTFTAVVLGCAHRGVENNVLSAMNVAGVTKIDLLIGGMHLNNAGQERLEATAEFLKDVTINQIVCCHCTGIGAYEYLKSQLGSKVSLGCGGMSWAL